MSTALTNTQFDAIAELLRLRDSKARDAARLVLVDGLEIGAAANQLGMPYKDAHQSVGRVKAGLDLAKIATGEK